MIAATLDAALAAVRAGELSKADRLLASLEAEPLAVLGITGSLWAGAVGVRRLLDHGRALDAVGHLEAQLRLAQATEAGRAA